MTACINKTMLCGFLGEDPRSADLPNGGSVVSMRLATTETWKTADNQRKSATEWHNVAIFNEGLGKVAMSYLRKGSAVYVEGQLRHRKYTDRTDVERWIAEVVLPKGRGEMKLMDNRQDDAARRETSGRDRGAGERPDLDDEVPF